MYEFIRIQYLMGRLTDLQVYAMAPKYITAEQAGEIVRKEA